MTRRDDQRTFAIIAHVDHGKTTLVDAMFQQSGIYRSNQAVVDRVMDSNDQERERGITILAKCTSIEVEGITFQIVDTPGHADFGGEVERTLNMVDGVLLLVDAAEGCLPQTRFVLRKTLALGLQIIVVINKIDRSDARPAEVLDEVYDLFIDLGADEAQLDFPVMYAIARDGIAVNDPDEKGDSLKPLTTCIINHFSGPEDHSDEPFAMRVNQIGYDEYVGRLMIGRVESGMVKTNQQILVQGQGDSSARARVTGVFNFRGTERLTLENARAGDIVALAGVDDVGIGDTLCDPETPVRLERFNIDEPTVAMIFQVNDSPMAGRSGGKYVTSRQLRDRLHREAFANVSIQVKEGDAPDRFQVMGRGELQLSVLIENLRREKYELAVRNPSVITREVDGVLQEPTERLVVDIPTEHMGVVSEMVGARRGTLVDQKMEGSRTRVEYSIPTRGLLGMRGPMLTATRGTAIASSVFEGWTPWQGDIERRNSGALVSDRKGTTTSYALFNLQPRGTLFCDISTDVYEGMIIGEHNRANDLNVNAVREKKLNNIRTHSKDESTVISTPRQMPLEACLEWIRDDEMVEVTPEAIRIRKTVLAANIRPVTKG